MDLINTKSLLAKLMATENITVEQVQCQTASFDVKNRVLTIPVLDSKISPELYDLFMGHEVGHALYTPENGMRKAIDSGLNMDIVNVVEDPRIERKIKNKYPGIRPSFVKGYRELIDKDFFGTSHRNINSLNFIDRANMYFKGGPAQGITFNDEEENFLKEMEKTETYDDVVNLSLKIMAYMNENNTKRQEYGNNNRLDDFDDIDDFDDSKSSNSNINTSDSSKNEHEDKNRSNSGQKEQEDDEYDSEQDGMGNSEGEYNEQEEQEEFPQKNTSFGMKGGRRQPFSPVIVSETNRAYQKNQSRLFKNGVNYLYGNIPDVDLSKCIIDYKQLWKKYMSINSQMKNHYLHAEETDSKLFMEIRNDAKKVSAYLAKEFERRKNADQMKRIRVSKSGDLDMNKIHSYNFSEDIFRRISVAPEGKSHGLIMILDWSGSMADNLMNTVKQLINLVMFCKKVGIPYEVYLFSSEWIKSYQCSPKTGDIVMKECNLLNVLSSKMSAGMFSYAGAALVRLAKQKHAIPDGFKLGGTPLNQSIMAAMKLVPQFKKDNKLQIVNTIFLTDGESCSTNEVHNIHNGLHQLDYSSHYDRTLVIRDPITKNQITTTGKLKSVTDSLIKLLRMRTDSNVIGFYVLDSNQFYSAYYGNNGKNTGIEDARSEFSKNHAYALKNTGYSEYYLINSKKMDTNTEEFSVSENATVRGMVKAFTKHTSGRIKNRMILNRFIELIA